MSTPEFDIIFRGDIVLGHQLAEVKLRLQQLFKVDAAKVDALFTGRPVPLKRKLDEATANKYRAALLKAGAQVVICSSNNTLAAKVSKPVGQSSARATPLADSTLSSTNTPSLDTTSAQWSLAPAGSDLLPTNQRPPAASPVVVDVTGLSLRAQNGNLLDAQELQSAPVADVVVPNLELAEVGATLSDEDHLPLPLIDIELEGWDIAEVGADLLHEDERPLIVPVVVDSVDFGLAPAGSDLGQLKPQVEPRNPDISALRMADNA